MNIAQEQALQQARILAGLGVPLFSCRMDKDGNPKPPLRWEQTAPGVDSLKAIDSWRPGMALCAVGGQVFDYVDVDPRNGGRRSWPKLLDALEADAPVIFGIVATPSHGWHCYIPAQGIAKCKLLPGIDLQAGDANGEGRGFVFIPPTERPSKHKRDAGTVRPYRWYMPVSAQGTPWFYGPSESLVKLAAAKLAEGPQNGSRGRTEPEELKRAALAAPDGTQRDALLALVAEYMRLGYTRDAIAEVLREFLPKMPLHDTRKPWFPASGHNPEYWVRNLLSTSRSFRARVPDATDEEMAGVRNAKPHRLPNKDEQAFWNSRKSLRHIHEWATARLTGPWAVFGESLAEAICHTPPTLQLPPIVGGEGTLNMLIAIVGKSGAGKNAAAKAARSAFKWTGIIGEIDNAVDRVPLGSGEGLAKTFGFNFKDKDTGKIELVRTRTSAIIVIPEIDTFAAINTRAGSTLSPELRKVYSGETLGFGYADIMKRIIIPEHEYRACIIAGVQPGRGEVILGDLDGGFAQRWLWLPAEDPSAPDEDVAEPGKAEWEPPGLIPSLAHSDGPYRMQVYAGARAAIVAARRAALRGETDDIETHSLYTRLKVAAGLALLDGCDEVRESDWDLAGFVMRKSAATRKAVSEHLARKAHEDNLARGRAEGVRKDAAEMTVHETVKARIAKNVLGKLGYEKLLSRSALSRRIAERDRPYLDEALRDLLSAERIEAADITYRNQNGVGYRKIKRQLGVYGKACRFRRVRRYRKKVKKMRNAPTRYYLYKSIIYIGEFYRGMGVRSTLVHASH